MSPCACFLQAPLIEAAKEFAADLTPSVGSQVRDKRALLFGYIDFLPVSAGNGHKEDRRPRVGAHISLLARGLLGPQSPGVVTTSVFRSFSISSKFYTVKFSV